jgi:hypothetical protein
MAKSKALTFGHNCKASINAVSYLVTAESLHATQEWMEPSEEGLIGTDKPANLGRILKKTDVKGGLTVRGSVLELEALLALWFDQNAGATTPADSPVGKTAAVVIDRGVAVHTYAACWLNALELSANENEPIDVLLELLGTTEAASGTVTAPTLTDRMRFSDCAFSLASNAYYPSGFKWRFSYELEERFLNSLVRSVVQHKIPICTLELTFDHNSDTYTDLFALAGTDTELDNCTVTINDGAHTLVLTMTDCCVMNPSKVPDGSGVEARKDTIILRGFNTTDIFTGAYT